MLHAPKSPLLILLLVLSLAAAAAGAPLSAVVVYGDSLSDNGNLFAASGGTFPAPPNFQGRRSNGPVAVEIMASTLGLPLIDYAWIGSTTGMGNYGDGGTTTSFGTLNLPGMATTFSMTSPTLAATVPGGIANAQFVVWGGANDFLAPSPLDTTAEQRIARSVTNLNNIVAGLTALGAQQILVPNMPDLGLTPYGRSVGAAAATAYTEAFNAQLAAQLNAPARILDTAAIVREIYGNPAAYGLTNVTDPCYTGTSVCSTPGTYLFWDDFHPTTAAHQVFGARLAAAAAPIPEPALGPLAVAALTAMVWARRRARLSR